MVPAGISAGSGTQKFDAEAGIQCQALPGLVRFTEEDQREATADQERRSTEDRLSGVEKQDSSNAMGWDIKTGLPSEKTLADS